MRVKVIQIKLEQNPRLQLGGPLSRKNVGGIRSRFSDSEVVVYRYPSDVSQRARSFPI